MFGGNISKSAGCRSMCCSILYLLLGLRPLQGVTLKTWHAVNSRNSFNMPANDKATTPKCPHEADVARYYGSGRRGHDWPLNDEVVGTISVSSTVSVAYTLGCNLGLRGFTTMVIGESK